MPPLMFFSTSTLLSRSKKRRNLDFTWAGEPHDSPVGTSAQPFGKPTSANRKTITRVELSHALYRTKVGLTQMESSALADRVLKEITDAIAERRNSEVVVVWDIHGLQEGPAHWLKSQNRRRGPNFSAPRGGLQGFSQNETENPE